MEKKISKKIIHATLTKKESRELVTAINVAKALPRYHRAEHESFSDISHVVYVVRTDGKLLTQKTINAAKNLAYAFSCGASYERTTI